MALPEFPVLVSILPFQEKKSQSLKLISSVAFVGLKISIVCLSHKKYLIFCEGGMSAAPTLVLMFSPYFSGYFLCHRQKVHPKCS